MYIDAVSLHLLPSTHPHLHLADFLLDLAAGAAAKQTMKVDDGLLR